MLRLIWLHYIAMRCLVKCNLCTACAFRAGVNSAYTETHTHTPGVLSCLTVSHSVVMHMSLQFLFRLHIHQFFFCVAKICFHRYLDKIYFGQIDEVFSSSETFLHAKRRNKFDIYRASFSYFFHANVKRWASGVKYIKLKRKNTNHSICWEGERESAMRIKVC